MSSSSLISYTKISPYRHSPRNHAIDTLSIHCYVGQASVEDAGEWFAKERPNGSSCNYFIGADGRIALIVPESDRSWCTSSPSNDHRAITIECASDKTAPYAINSKVYNALIGLCVDICQRNNIKELKWKADKSLIGQVDKQNMTVHRWFANKDCPGEYIYSRLGAIAETVNRFLIIQSGQNGSNSPYPSTPFSVKVIIDDLNIREKPTASSNSKGYTEIGSFTITEVQNDWGKLKSGAGWIYIGNPSYCTIVKESPKPTKEFMVRVDTYNLNVRTGPGTNYSKTGPKTGIGTFTITEVKEGPGSDSGWGKLKSGAGWIALDYVTRV